MLKRIAKFAGFLLAAVVILSILNPFFVYRVNRYDPVDFVGYYEYSGVIGVHTKYSDGGLSYADLGKIADSLNMHFVITTDVNTDKAMARSLERRYGMTLMIPAVEISAHDGRQRFLVIGDSIPTLPGDEVTVDSALAQATSQGSFVVACDNRNHSDDVTSSSDIGVPFSGIELYNFSRDLRSMVSLTGVNKLFGAFLDYTMDQRTLNYLIRYRKNRMSEFDKLNDRRKIVGIATTTLPPNTLLKKSGGVRFPSYESELEFVHTIIVTKTPYSAQYSHDRDLTIEALKRGHMYVAFSGLEPARGFYFTATSGDTTGMMGDSLRLYGRAQLRISLPDSNKVETRVLKDGNVIRKYENTGSISLGIKSPGIYRVEVFQKRTMLPLFLERSYPWIISNPIYIYKR